MNGEVSKFIDSGSNLQTLNCNCCLLGILETLQSNNVHLDRVQKCLEVGLNILNSSHKEQQKFTESHTYVWYQEIGRTVEYGSGQPNFLQYL
jgi:hypothetical protein